MITADNLDEYVDVQGDCWLWQGWVSAKGYGHDERDDET